MRTRKTSSPLVVRVPVNGRQGPPTTTRIHLGRMAPRQKRSRLPTRFIQPSERSPRAVHVALRLTLLLVAVLLFMFMNGWWWWHASLHHSTRIRKATTSTTTNHWTSRRDASTTITTNIHTTSSSTFRPGNTSKPTTTTPTTTSTDTRITTTTTTTTITPKPEPQGWTNHAAIRMRTTTAPTTTKPPLPIHSSSTTSTIVTTTSQVVSSSSSSSSFRHSVLELRTTHHDDISQHEQQPNQQETKPAVASSVLVRDGDQPPPTTTKKCVVVVAGLIRSLTELAKSTRQLLYDLSCHHHVSIHVVTASLPWSKENNDNKEENLLHRNNQQAAWHWLFPKHHETPSLGCAALMVELEQDLLLESDPNTTTTRPQQPKPASNRIVRLAQIRDVQRRRIQDLWFSSSSSNQYVMDQSVVMVMDLDLVALPKAMQLMQATQQMFVVGVPSSPSFNHNIKKEKHRTQNSQPIHVMCGLGLTRARRQASLYDTYATIFLPNTFAHPLKRRKVPRYFEGEDPALVRSADNVHGNFTQWHMTQYIVHVLAKHHPLGMAPVRSCFGGLALYQAATFFQPQCQYSVTTPAQDDATTTPVPFDWRRYANREEGQACEHVVFHECLHRQQRQHTASGGINHNNNHNNSTPLQVVMNPRLVVLWKKD